MVTLSGFKLLTADVPVLDRAYKDGRVPLEGGGSIPMEVYIPREQGNYLYSLVRYLRPRSTVEIGMANGFSTAFIASALRDNGEGRHLAIDPFQSTEWGNRGIGLLRLAGLLDRVEVAEAYAHHALPHLERAISEDRDCPVDFVFVDGSHLFDFVMADFLLADRILRARGLIAFDDSDYPSVSSALRFVLFNRNYEVVDTGVTIEPPPGRSSRVAGVIRRLTGLAPRVAARLLNPSFLRPSESLGLHGRCVVLQKMGDDNRDSQSKAYVPF